MATPYTTTTRDFQERPIERVNTPDEALMGLDYPVVHERQRIMEMARDHQSFVLVGETGSGKTTCLPIMLMELKSELGLTGKIAVTQPRRVAARSVARRVAELMDCEVGATVGYKVRFEDETSEGTDINFMTDGILLRKMQFDPLLTDYSIVMIDEAHERSLNIDLTLGLLKDANKRRIAAGIEPIRIAVTSATIEREKFARYFGNGDAENSIEIPGKMFPVQVSYEAQNPLDFMQAGATKVKQIIDSGDDGDILVFMPGKEEIDRTVQGIEKMVDLTKVEILRLHADVSPEDQDRIFKPNGKRKIIVSTNIAETSVTVPSVRHVVDSGLIKQIEFDAEAGIETLALRPHAISGLEQRKGRAGRVAPGKCYRLFTQDSLKERSQFQKPEIQRSELAHVVLTMKTIGITDVENFDFIDPPDATSVKQAIQTLTSLGALDEKGSLTKTGILMAKLGLEPKLGRMVVEAKERDCILDICTIAAFVGGKRVFNRPREHEAEADSKHVAFKNPQSDFLTLLNVWDAYAANGFKYTWAKDNYLNGRVLEEAGKIRLELLRVLRRNDITVPDQVKAPKDRNADAIGKSITAGLIGTLMEYQGYHAYRKLDGTQDAIYIHPSSGTFSVSKSGLMVAASVLENPSGKKYASTCLMVKPEWLPEVAPQLVKSESLSGLRYDPEEDAVVREFELVLKGSRNRAVLGQRRETVTGPEAFRAFATALVRGEVRVPEHIRQTLDYNRDQIVILNDLWRRTEGQLEE